jgi:hypothetical protein
VSFTSPFHLDGSPLAGGMVPAQLAPATLEINPAQKCPGHCSPSPGLQKQLVGRGGRW